MTRAALMFLVAVGAMTPAAAQDAPPMRVRSAICLDKFCADRAQAAFAPARIRVEVFVPLDARNRLLSYGVACDGEWASTSGPIDLDGKSDAPLYVVEYRNIPAGQCHAEALVTRADGTQDRRRSLTMLLKSQRDDED